MYFLFPLGFVVNGVVLLNNTLVKTSQLDNLQLKVNLFFLHQLHYTSQGQSDDQEPEHGAC